MPTQSNLFIEDLYSQIELEMLQKIGKLLGNGQGITADGIVNWQVEKLSQLGRLTQEQIQVIAKYANLTVEQVIAFVQDTAIVEVQTAEQLLDERTQGILLYQEPSNALYTRLEALEQQATDIANKVNSSMLQGAEQVYRDIIEKSVANVLLGNTTLDQTLQSTVSEWAKMGIPAFVDKTGRQWSTEGYVSMVMRATRKNVVNTVQETKFDDYDVDLVEATSHRGSRPSHIEYQGKIYSRSGRSKRYPALSSTTYGKGADGFVTGIHCGHILYAYVQGVSTKRYEPYDKEESIAVYNEQQKQRRLERDIRSAKKELAMLEQMGVDDMKLQHARKKVADKQANMRAFIGETGRTRRYNRERIVADGRPRKPVERKELKTRLADNKKKIETEKVVKRAVEEPKLLKAKEVDALKGKKLREVARDTALAYYKSNQNTLSFGGNSPESIVNSLIVNQSDTALRKDIKSMQRQLKGWSE